VVLSHLEFQGAPAGAAVSRTARLRRVPPEDRDGFSAAAPSLIEVVRMFVYMLRNTRVLMAARRLGSEIKSLSQGEITTRAAGYKSYSVETWRAGHYIAH
jgi:hypothetical protein